MATRSSVSDVTDVETSSDSLLELSPKLDTSSSSAELADVESSGNSSEQTSARTLLDFLKSPTPSSLARKRKVAANPPPKGEKRSRGLSASDPKNISPSDRVKAYLSEPFKVSNHKLFCYGCREELSLKKNSINIHIKSTKHAKNKERLKVKEGREADIAEALTKYQERVHPKGETLPECIRIFRVKVVRAMLQAGISIKKVDLLRELLEETGYSLTHSSHLRELIPFILEQETNALKEEIRGKHLSIIFDGTTHVCEAFVVVVRFMSDWKIKQRVCRLMLLEKSLTGEELARQLITVISTELSVQPSLVIGGMRDRASVNNVARRTISVVYNKMMDVGCFSHTLDHVGEKMNTLILSGFITAWVNLFSRSPKAKLIWKTQTGIAVLSYSTTRWWSKFEVIKQVRDMFGDVITFLSNKDLPAATTGKLLSIVEDIPKLRELKVELAVTVDAMNPFVNATYSLEGDGPLVLYAYQTISSLYAHISLAHHPNVAAIAKNLAQGNPAHESQLLSYANMCYPPAYSYFKEKFNNDLKNVLQAFKAARYFLPYKMSELKPTVSDIDELKSFPFLDSNIVGELKAEMAEYVAAAEGVVETVNPLVWWKAKEDSGSLLSWVKALKLVLLVQPSSAAAERVFSILQNTFNASQESALEDYIQLSVMMQYNRS